MHYWIYWDGNVPGRYVLTDDQAGQRLPREEGVEWLPFQHFPETDLRQYFPEEARGLLARQGYYQIPADLKGWGKT